MIERKLVVEAFDERRAVLVQERDESDRAFLRVAAGEGERARVHELPAERFVAALRRLDHLAVERLQVVLHALAASSWPRPRASGRAPGPPG